MGSGLIALKPVRSYARARYPTREEARDLGIDLYRVPDSAILRYGKGTIVGATCLMLSSSCIPIGLIAGGYILSEADARAVIQRVFSNEGIDYAEDVQYEGAGVTFNADGYDEELGFGFEYHSTDDRDESLRLRDTLEWHQMFLDSGETSILEDEMSSGGDAIKVFEAGNGTAQYDERALLEAQVEEFIDWLRENGRL
jgi:hypothetical protein